MSTFETARQGLLWDATAVPNAFFCEYMPDAPENHVKVYLLGLMWTHSGAMGEDDMLEEIARTLLLSREKVDQAMRYWERRRLVERIQDQPPRYRFLSLQQAMVQRQQVPMEDDAYQGFAQAVYAAFGDKRKLHGGDTVLAYEWVEQLGLPPEVVLMLIQHMIATRGLHFSFKEAQKVAVMLSEQKVHTLEEAEAVFERSEAATTGAQAILRHLRILGREPTEDEIDLYVKWTKEWGFKPEGIRKACRETTKGSPTFAYLDKVLEGVYSRSEGKATSAKQVQKNLEERDAETAQVREMLAALGVSNHVIDDGRREQYRAMAAVGGHELVMLAAREVARHSGTHDSDRVQKLLDAWAEKGMTTLSAVNAYLAEVELLNRQIRALMEIAGASGGCTQANRAWLKQWTQEWKLPQALIELAAEYARGTAKPMTYMHKLLSGWREAGVANVEEARAAHERHVAQAQKKPERPAQSAPKRVIEQQYEQRTYAPGELDEIPEDLLEELKKL